MAQGAPVRPYYFNVRLQKDRPCVLVVVGATEDGHKELLAIQDGERESHLSWDRAQVNLLYQELAIQPVNQMSAVA